MLCALLLCTCVSVARAQELVREFSWAELKKNGQLAAGEVVTDDVNGDAALKLENTAAEPKTITVLDVDKPGVTTVAYAMEGRMRYENVAGTGYLEMWNRFANGGMYFSRTLGNSGPMQSLSGSSPWRPFALPFFSDRKSGSPTRLVVNVVLPGKGAVYLSPIRLVQYQGDELAAQLHRGDGWWNGATAGWIGGIGGGAIGLLGGLIGLMTSLGKARRFVLTLIAGLTALGVICFVVGVAAAILRQPYAVYYPLLLAGGIVAAVCGCNLPIIRRRYEELELRKIDAMDVH